MLPEKLNSLSGSKMQMRRSTTVEVFSDTKHFAVDHDVVFELQPSQQLQIFCSAEKCSLPDY